MWSSAARVIVTLGLLAALLTADAQPRRHIPVIGVLANDDLLAALANPKSPVSALRQGLREMGYVEGQNIAMEYRPHGEKPAPLSTYAAELVHRKVDVLVTFGALPTGATREATTTIPIVFACTADPVALGFVAQPGTARGQHHRDDRSQQRSHGETVRVAQGGGANRHACGCDRGPDASLLRGSSGGGSRP